jgi:hypothetical protein
LTAADAGRTIRLRVIASNEEGASDPVFSDATNAVDPP